MISNFWKILSPFHGTFRWFVVLLIIYEGLQLVEGYLISLVVRLFTAQVEIILWVALFVGLIIYDELFNRLDNAVDYHVVTRHSYPIYKHLKLGAVAKFLQLDLQWHQSRNSGALVGKVSNGVWKVIEILDGLSWEFIPTLIQTVLSIIPLLIFSPNTALVAGVTFFFFLWLTVKANKERTPLRIKRHDLYEEEWHRSIEEVQAIETSIVFGQRERLLREQEKLHDQIIALGTQEAQIGIFRYNRWRIRLLTWARRLILAIWVSQLLSGSLDVANLIFVSVLTEKLFSSFWRFARLFDRASEASEGAGRLAALMNESNQIEDGDQSLNIPGPVSIRFEDVCFSYSGEYNETEGALHNFNLDIPGGHVVALVGPSGAGKTTIRKVVTRLVDIQSGSIQVGGLDIKRWQKEELIKLFSYVPQGDDVHIFDRSVKDNIAFPKPDSTLEEVRKAAKLAGIHDFIMTLPDGYETVVGERGKRLSGGQKQRVALARAIVADRPVLILDEATSSVDAITEAEIQSQMKEVLEGKTAIIIAHRLSTVWDIADIIVVMEGGRKAEEGSHEDLVEGGGLYAKMVALQTV